MSLLLAPSPSLAAFRDIWWIFWCVTARDCCRAQRILDGEAAADEAQFLEPRDEAGSSFASAASLEEEFEAVKAEKAASLSSLFEDEDLVEVDAGVQDESLLVRDLRAGP